MQAKSDSNNNVTNINNKHPKPNECKHQQLFHVIPLMIGGLPVAEPSCFDMLWPSLGNRVIYHNTTAGYFHML